MDAIVYFNTHAAASSNGGQKLNVLKTLQKTALTSIHHHFLNFILAEFSQTYLSSVITAMSNAIKKKDPSSA